MYICVSVRDRLGSSSDLGGVWRSRAEYVWRVVYYWVQCVIVRVTCGARSVHSAVQRAGTSDIYSRAARPHGQSVYCK